MLAVALGAASLLISSPLIFSVVRTLGALYLAWMGFGLLRNGVLRLRSAHHEETGNDLQIRMMRLHPLVAALSLSLTNPKAIFFFIAFFSQFIRPDFSSPTHTFIYLAVVLQILSMMYLAGLIWVGQRFLTFFQRRPRFTAVLWILAGAMFIGFAIRLLLA